MLRRRLGNTFDAADLAHDAFLRLLLRPRSFDSTLSLRAYLGRMANGMCVDLWRRQSLERAWAEELARAPEQTQSDAEHRALVLEALCEIDAMLALLPEKVRQAFLMAQVEEMTYREIAEHLSVSERMVKKYMARAMVHCALHESALGSLAA